MLENAGVNELLKTSVIPMSNARTKKTRGGPSRTSELRLKHLCDMGKALADGRSPTEVAESAAVRHGISIRAAWDDLAEVRRHWAEEAERMRATPNGSLGLALVRRDLLFRRSLETGDYALAMKVEQDRCKLLGLYPSEKSEQLLVHNCPAWHSQETGVPPCQ